MNERIKELAEQAGLDMRYLHCIEGDIDDLERFAELVRQDYLRELKALKPVAWETFALKFANGQVLSYEKPKDLPSYLGCRPLIALDEVMK